MDNNETPVAPAPEKSKVVAAILAILLGWVGAHKFYLGYQKEGIILACVGVIGFLACGIGTSIASIIGIVEGIIYLTKSDEEFKAIYIDNKKPWF